jgi:exodeoxyribonuclease VII large subunit
LIRAADARAARELRLRFGDGEVDAIVDGAPAKASPVERKPRRSYVAPQPGLFDPPEE